MRRSLLKTAVAAVLLCAAVRGSAQHVVSEPEGVKGHRRDLDALPARTVSTRVSRGSRVADTAAQPQVVTAPPDWKPIRIAVFSYDIEDSSRYCTEAEQLRPDFTSDTVVCEPEDVLTASKKQTLLEFLIPSAVRMHEERLSVQRERGNIVVDRLIDQDPYCRDFSIPDSHMREGVANADFLLYVAAGPIPSGATAWALTCQYFTNGRPSVGIANFSPEYIANAQQTMRVVAHEILHALGFNYDVFEEQGMVGYVPSRGGKSDVPVINSPMVVAQARAHFGCSTQAFLELEDMGGRGTELSHWKRRSMKDDLMAGTTVAGIYSAITIAAMEDMGFYKGNYSMAEPMMYGRNAGCRLMTEKCVVNGVSKFPEMFCGSANDSKLVCASDRLSVGFCYLVNHDLPLPPQFQYFSDATLGDADEEMDYCPYVQPYRRTFCSFDGRELKGSVYGARSRCFDAPAGFAEGGQSSAQYGLCAKVRCETTTYSVKVRGAGTFTRCTPGTTLTLSSLSSEFSDGHITCPPYDSVCGMRVNTTQTRRPGAAVADGTAAGSSVRMAGVLAAATAVLALLPW
ncbi:major surface protease gp63 [Novymonas esmeraldas]|uniref:Leishmanolysin-like peptidase n=1 Tax=Novymonas esmeraldas TaxID=1808958 RepID=A0AAW0F1P5_9TRYP